MELLIVNANLLFEKSLPTHPTGSVPERVNAHGSQTSQTSVASRQSEEAQVAGLNPQRNRHSTITSVSSSSLSCPPMSPACSSADSSWSPKPTQSPVLSELPFPNLSALHLYTGAADQPEPDEDRVSVADARNKAAYERGWNHPPVFQPLRLTPLPEQQQERKQQSEASLAFMHMSPQTVSSYDQCTTVGSLNSPPALGSIPFSP
jgi:hypothetical protein